MQNFPEMRYFSIIFLFLISFLSFTACDIINPSEKIPSYIHVDSFVLKGNYKTVGTVSQAITDAWVFVDNEYIGTFELPADIPILKTGMHHIFFKAGIKENGISNTRLWYPFYDTIGAYIDLKPNITDTINPIISYNPSGFKMPVNEDFEDPSFQFTKSDNSNINLESTDKKEYVFEGSYSMLAKMYNKYDLLEIIGTELYSLPRNKAIFMELNYKSNIVLKVGYFAYSSAKSYQHLVLNLNPTTTWKKVYVNFGGEIAFEPTTYNLKVFIGAQKTTSTDTSVVQLDNIKLLYLE
jgi:hypothetical protein